MPIFKKARKSGLKLKMGYYGPSGAGKTISSLAIAREFGDRIALIDSEHGSSDRYADLFDFDSLKLSNRSLQNYIAAIEAAGVGEYQVCIIDSLSHAWLSVLEEIDRLPQNRKMLGWARVNPELERLKDAILKSPCHVIATFRAKTEWVMENVNGRVKPLEIGLGPVFRNGIAYEFDVFGSISQQVLEIQKSRCPTLQGQSFLNPGKEFVDLLKAWMSEFPGPASESAPEQPPEDDWRRWRSPDDAIDWAWNKLPNCRRDELKKLFDELPPDSNNEKIPVWREYIENRKYIENLAQEEEMPL